MRAVTLLRRLPAARALVAAVVSLGAGAAIAAHPFITEDPGTQGAGKFELELGAAARRGAPEFDGREVGIFPQFSIGATDSVDLIVQAIVLRQMPANAPTVFGAGDTLVDVKWRFYESEPWAFAVRAGVDLPTGDVDRGLGSGRVGYHAIAVAGFASGAYAVYANAIYARTQQPGVRANLGAFSIALTRPDDAPLRGFIEAATFSNTDPSNAQWPAVARTGFIYSVTSWLDVDLGFQARLNRAAARQVWLAGATLRW